LDTLEWDQQRLLWFTLVYRTLDLGWLGTNGVHALVEKAIHRAIALCWCTLAVAHVCSLHARSGQAWIDNRNNVPYSAYDLTFAETVEPSTVPVAMAAASKPRTHTVLVKIGGGFFSGNRWRSNAYKAPVVRMVIADGNHVLSAATPAWQGGLRHCFPRHVLTSRKFPV
jgi:hypothetical protein